MSHLLRRPVVCLSAAGGVLAVLIIATGWAISHVRGGAEMVLDGDDLDLQAIPVKTVRPIQDVSFVHAIQEPAHVEAYNEADLYSRVSGIVKYIEKDEGDSVYEGEVLVEIDVPDLAGEVAQKDALVKQARADEVAAEAHVRVLEAAVQTARNQIALREAERDYRQADLRRIQVLHEKNVVYKDAVDEAQKFLKAAEAAVEVARSDLSVARAKLVAAEADLDVKEARVYAAEKEKEKVQAQEDFAKVRAKFNGQIVKRHKVNVGTFVQNASSAQTRPLLTIKQLDKVRVFCMVPAKAAPYINKDTEAIIRIEGIEVRSKITRYADWLDKDKGRDMRVEVVIYNPPEPDYAHALQCGMGSLVTSVGGLKPLSIATLLTAGQHVSWGKRGILKDGHYGTMELILQKFEGGYTIPATAIRTEKGETYIYEVKNQRVHRVPVRVDLEDAIRARVSVIVRKPVPSKGIQGVYRGLTGKEEIVYTNQGELSEGQLVRAVLEEPRLTSETAVAGTHK